MKRTTALCHFVSVVVLLQATSLCGKDSVTTVERPPTDVRNRHYVSNRPPLQPNAFVKLPIGSVMPDGWLLEMIERQRDGLCGNLGRVSAWLQKDDNAWLDKEGRGAWGWEELPYWLKGYGNIGYLLDDEQMIAEARVWIEGTLGSQRPSGDFGPAHGSGKLRDYWGNMIMLYCLQSYYEHSGDPRVLELMTKYFRFQLAVPDDELLESYWQWLRGGDNLHSIMWLYNRTGDKFLLDLAEKMHRNTADWTSRKVPRSSMRGRQHKREGTEWPDWYETLIDWHNVNIAQSFREPAQYYQLSGNASDLQATYDVFHLVRRHFGQMPGGMYAGDENSRPGYDDPRQGIETCGMVEQLNSNQHLLRITGDPFWADHAENVAFNSLPVAFMPDMRSLRYITSANMVLCDANSHAPGIDNGGPFLIMNPFSSRCCQHNHAQGWPYYAENCWMATPDNGLLASLYVASHVTAKVGDQDESVTIKEVTNYPFEESVTVQVTDGGGRFPLYLRIPAWCDNASVTMNGEKVEADTTPARYVRIERTWKEGDQVTLSLPMKLSLTTWTANHNSVSLNHGPLTYSLKIKEEVVRRDSIETAIGDSKWQKDADPSQWPSFELHPGSAWNYGLVLGDQPLTERRLQDLFVVTRRPWPKNNYPFTTDDVPISIKAKAQRIPEWTLDQHDLVAELQDSPVRSGQPVEEVTLIPMGAARLRISAFPVIGTGDDAVQWKPSPQLIRKFTASASHTFQGNDVRAIADGLEPENSADHEIPRHTFWPHKGTDEWLEARFDEPRTLSACEVYWFDDTGIGECRVPKSWRLYYLQDDEWQTVYTEGTYAVDRDRFNRITFTPVTTRALKLEVKLQDDVSAGVLEWKVEDQQP